MEMTRKILVLAGVALLLSGLYFGFFRGGVTGKVVLNDHYTKAICNESNFCQDYEVYCDEGLVMETRAITGAVVQNSEDWTDPRGEEAEKLC